MGFYDHTVGLYFESKDGLNWQKPSNWLVWSRALYQTTTRPKHLKRYGRFERPQVLMKKWKTGLPFHGFPRGKSRNIFRFRL